MNSQIISAWIYTATKTLYVIIVTGVIMKVMHTPEINVWLIFFNIINFSEFVLVGFNSTFVRYFSYTVAGLHYSLFDSVLNEKNKKEISFDVKNQIYEIFKVMKMVFNIISIVYFVLLFIGGYLFLYKPVQYTDNIIESWLSWAFILCGNVVRMYFYPYAILIQGVNDMVRYYGYGALVNVLLIVVSIFVSFYYKNILLYSLINGLFVALLSIAYVVVVRKKYINREVYRGVKYNKEIFKNVINASIKTGVAKILAPVTQNMSGLVVAQMYSPVMSASYMLLQQYFGVLVGFSNNSFSSQLPTIARLRAKGEMNNVNKLIFKVSQISYWIIVIGYVFLVVFGDKVLLFFKKDIFLPSNEVIALFAVGYIFNRNTGIQLSLTNIANLVIEHYAIFFLCLVYVFIVYMFIDNMRYMVFPFALLVSSVFTNIYVYRYSYKLYNTSFLGSEKYVFVPAVILVLILNVVLIYFDL